MKNRITAFIVTLCIFLIIPMSSHPKGYYGSYGFPMSVYASNISPSFPRRYVVFDHIENCFFLTLPYLGGGQADFISGTWTMKGDTALLTPNVYLFDKHGELGFDDYSNQVPNDVPPPSSFKFLVKDDYLIEIDNDSNLFLDDYDVENYRELIDSINLDRSYKYYLVHGAGLKLNRDE